MVKKDALVVNLILPDVADAVIVPEGLVTLSDCPVKFPLTLGGLRVVKAVKVHVVSLAPLTSLKGVTLRLVKIIVSLFCV